ncbi:MAG: inorganic phosphate transporter family protein, partial [Nanoarchaeota archaeon]|nr:inorganic phosphate transporter family protein [Nanoarchaeota archaeon]
STYKGIPVSTTQAVIGAIAAVAVAVQATVNWGLIGKMFLYWLISPFLALILSYIAYLILDKSLRRYSFMIIDKLIYVLVLGSGIFLAYSLGANNVGNAMGLVVSSDIMTPVIAGLLGGLFIAFGSISFGKNVMKTVSNGIMALDARMAFAAQLGGGITVYLLTALAIPTSTSHAIIGGIAGVGLVKGVASINKKEVKRVVKGWIVTPLLSAVVAVIIFFILKTIL